MSEATLQQKIIDLRSQLIQSRICKEKDQQVINLMQNRVQTLEFGLYEVMRILDGSGVYTPGINAYHAAYKAIHSD